ncbi:MAG: non-ribosomal peptide synthetase, partial [Chloroflexi bacterium]|nr:non-ribosomal peptide synthetase [Chloroflexota bacterium]
MPLVDLRDAPDRDAQALRIAEDDARAPFDLARGPLVRARLLRLADDAHIFLCALHHIIADGWSLGIFVRELAALYSAFATSQSPSLPDLPLQYADFACWQRAWLPENLETQLAYWKNRLSDLPALNLPTDRPRPASQTNRGAQFHFTLPIELRDALAQVSQREGVTLFMTLIAGFELLLHRYTGQIDFGIGTPIANRTRGEIENLIGLFVNTLVLRADFSGAPTFHELLQRVREDALGAYAHQDVPFEMLVDALRPERSLSYAPLFQVMFSLQSAPDRDLNLPGLRAQRETIPGETAKFDLTLMLEEEPGQLRGTFEYATDLFDADTIARMAGHYETLLESIVANPNLPLTTYQLLAQPELDQILIEWNDTRADVPRDQCIHSLFEHQVEKTPDAIAVVYENASLTYRE